MNHVIASYSCIKWSVILRSKLSVKLNDFILMADTDVVSNGGTTPDTLEYTQLQANTQLEREESDVEKAISEVIVQVCDIYVCVCTFVHLSTS